MSSLFRLLEELYLRLRSNGWKTFHETSNLRSVLNNYRQTGIFTLVEYGGNIMMTFPGWAKLTLYMGQSLVYGKIESVFTAFRTDIVVWHYFTHLFMWYIIGSDNLFRAEKLRKLIISEDFQHIFLYVILFSMFGRLWWSYNSNISNFVNN